MWKYLFKRLLRGAVSVVVAVSVIMFLMYFVMDKTLIFAEDTQYQKLTNNQKTTYMYTTWESYGYLDYVSYNDFINERVANGEMSEDFKTSIATIGRTAGDDSEDVEKYVREFTDLYTSRGYTILRLDAVMATPRRVATGGGQTLFAYQNTPVPQRMASFFGSLLSFDNIHYVKEDIAGRGLHFTLYDPAYGGKVFSPAITGSGTFHKYLLYFDGNFPFIHQNFLKLRLGTSFTVHKGVDVFETMNQTQGRYVTGTTYYPTGLVEQSADNMHTATYVAGSRDLSPMYSNRFTDDYTSTQLVKNSGSKVYYSFIISIIGTLLTMPIGLALGILMAKKKDTWVAGVGDAYAIFMIAVPSLAYYFMFKAFAFKIGLPVLFSLDDPNTMMYFTPVLASLAGGCAGQMRWMRRYMVDQMNSDYVKFARAAGLSEWYIFVRHIFKNAAIPITHGIPGMFIGALSGSIVSERIYAIPGVGGLLVEAIGANDNAVIVGLAVFYGSLFILSAALGDIVMAIMDPRISFTARER